MTDGKESNEARETGSLLGKGSEFAGKLSFIGTVRIEGTFDGEIYSEDTLVVGDGGVVKGRVDVDTLIVTGGHVEADVVARSTVELYPPGSLSGQVVTPAFQIEKGAVFRGQCLMPEESDPPSEESPAGKETVPSESRES